MKTRKDNMWTFFWMFLWGGLIIIVVTMVVVGNWMRKRWSWHRPNADDIVNFENQKQEVFELWLENQAKQDELTEELNATDWYPYIRDTEGNVFPKNP